MKQENFVLTVENIDSPVIITVPHGGMKNTSGSWLENFFQPRTKYEDPEWNYMYGEKIAIGGDSQVLHVVMDILKGYKANIVAGLLPRIFVDYNRFVPEVAYSDPKIKPFYDAYHDSISRTIETLLKYHKNVFLIDFHGFGKQPIPYLNFDIILGTNDGESSLNDYDKLFYENFSKEYRVFLSGMDGLPRESEMYRGDSTNLFYSKKYGIDGVLLEISPLYRTGDRSKSLGSELSSKLAKFLYFNF